MPKEKNNCYKKKGALPQTTTCQKSRQQTEESKERRTIPPTISIVPYPPQQSPREEKPVQPRHPPQASSQINSTGPTLHTAEPHTEENMTRPARKLPGTQNAQNKHNKKRVNG